MNRLINTIIFLNLLYTVSLSQDAVNIEKPYKFVDEEYYTAFIALTSAYLQYLNLYAGESTDDRVKGSIMFDQEIPPFNSLVSKGEDEVLFLADVITDETNNYRYQALALFSYTFRDKYPAPHALAFAIKARESLEELYLPLKDSIEMMNDFTFEEGIANLTEDALLRSTQKKVEKAWGKSLAMVCIILEEEGYLED